MVKKAIAGNPHFELSLIEMNEDGYTYTYRTLERLKQENPDTDYYFIIGADSLYDFATWKEPARICRACTIVVAARNHVPTLSLDQEMTYLSHQYGGCLRRKENLNTMAEYDFIKIQKKLSKYLDENRFHHTLGVMYTCAALAMAHDCPIADAQLAGLLHDCAKCIPNKKKLKMCGENRIPVTEFEKEHPFLLHAKLGAFVAKDKYGIRKKEILSAIAFHTTGKPDMSLLEKIVYIADYIEPGRDRAQNLPEIRKIAFQDLDECMYVILKDTLDYLEETPGEIDSATEDAFAYYKDLHTKRQGS